VSERVEIRVYSGVGARESGSAAQTAVRVIVTAGGKWETATLELSAPLVTGNTGKTRNITRKTGEEHIRTACGAPVHEQPLQQFELVSNYSLLHCVGYRAWCIDYPEYHDRIVAGRKLWKKMWLTGC
jgi:hypothetical protein